jgi:hypothetical protein
MSQFIFILKDIICQQKHIDNNFDPKPGTAISSPGNRFFLPLTA